MRRLLTSSESGGKHTIVALGFAKGQLVSIGRNDYRKTHPTQQRYAVLVDQPERIYLHAEIAAIIRAKCQLDELFVFRVNHKGQYVNAKPCKICQAAIDEAGIRRVHHS